MNSYSTPGAAWGKMATLVFVFLLVSVPSRHAVATENFSNLPTDAMPALHYLLEFAEKPDPAGFSAQRVSPLIALLQSSISEDVYYRADSTFDAPSAYNEFSVDVDLQRIIDYTLNEDIPSFCFWPSSLRFSRWIFVDGGDRQLSRFRAASNQMDIPFFLKGTEHITITPDQHTGTYFSYEFDKLIIFCPYEGGKAMITIQMQKKPSEVGKKGWVLGQDDEWSYLYTREKGVGVKGLGWADTYIYNSFGVAIYYQPDPHVATVRCGTVSWMKAGWYGINMVQPIHIYRGLIRAANSFKAVMENNRLPEPAELAETFSKTDTLPTPMLRKYTTTYFTTLGHRLAESKTIWNQVHHFFDSQTSFVDQMTRDEMIAVLALDYFKKVLYHNPVMEIHPFSDEWP